MNFRTKVKSVNKHFTEQQEATTIELELDEDGTVFHGKIVSQHDIDVRVGSTIIVNIVDWRTELMEWDEQRKREQVTMAAELNQPASPIQSIQESPESLEQDVAK